MRRAVHALALALTMGLVAAPATSSAGEIIVLERVIAVVNDDVILQSELRTWMQLDPEVMTALQQLGANPPQDRVQEKLASMESVALDNLIGNRLMLAEAPRLQIAATEQEVDSYLATLARENGMASADDLKAAVEASGQYGSWEAYRSSLREQIVLFKVQGTLATWNVTEAQVRDYYRKLSEGEEASASVIRLVFRPESDESAARDAAYAEAKRAARRLAAQEDPEVVAESLDQDATPKSYERSDLAPTLRDPLFDAREGEVIGPLRSGQGFVVFKVLEIEASDLLGFDEARENLRMQLEGEAQQRSIKELVEDLRAKAHVEIKI